MVRLSISDIPLLRQLLYQTFACLYTFFSFWKTYVSFWKTYVSFWESTVASFGSGMQISQRWIGVPRAWNFSS